MRIYLDNCCLNRPFDDQTQPRTQDESEAVKIILDRVVDGNAAQLKIMVSNPTDFAVVLEGG